MIPFGQHIDRLQRYADRTLLIIGALLVLISFAAAFSTSSNLVNHYRVHGAGYYLMKHFFLVAAGVVIFFVSSSINTSFYKKYAHLLLWMVIALVIFTDIFGQSAGVENVRRWLRFGPISVQPSLMALTFSLMFTAFYLDKIKNTKTDFSYDLRHYWIWLGILTGAVVIYNNSTALLIMTLNSLLLFLGGYGFKKFVYALLLGLVGILMYFLAAKAFPQYIPNRIDTLINRFERFTSKEKQQTDIQPLRAKIAIASGGLIRFAPGKSVQKNLLSQSSSDFIYAVIVEEYGALLGGVVILILYILLSIKILAISRLSKNYYEKLLVLALGLPITFQAFINMAVAVGAIPVTGQPLPVISAGGTTLFMTAFALGVIIRIGISAKMQENQTDE